MRASDCSLATSSPTCRSPHTSGAFSTSATHTAPKSRFSDELEDYMISDADEQTLRAVIDWGRYAEAFPYDDETQTLGLDNPA